jgi:hypothetical protein
MAVLCVLFRGAGVRRQSWVGVNSQEDFLPGSPKVVVLYRREDDAYVEDTFQRERRNIHDAKPYHYFLLQECKQFHDEHTADLKGI